MHRLLTNFGFVRVDMSVIVTRKKGHTYMKACKHDRIVVLSLNLRKLKMLLNGCV